jgi:hypothetical protein
LQANDRAQEIEETAIAKIGNRQSAILTTNSSDFVELVDFNVDFTRQINALVCIFWLQFLK